MCSDDCEIDTSSCQPLSVSSVLIWRLHVHVDWNTSGVNNMFVSSQLLVFALSMPLSGSAINTHFPVLPSPPPPSPHLNTTLQADLACQVDARRLGLHGTYVAMLSAHRRSLYNIIPGHHRNLPVINIKVLKNPHTKHVVNVYLL